mmetsp:Transcript_131482/g.366439  ORF Transcript_131482/g.366439 Transcript_131482/m.366439 type:complete len:261 (+) Transcript_131482:1163-1945(+)
MDHVPVVRLLCWVRADLSNEHPHCGFHREGHAFGATRHFAAGQGAARQGACRGRGAAAHVPGHGRQPVGHCVRGGVPGGHREQRNAVLLLGAGVGHQECAGVLRDASRHQREPGGRDRSVRAGLHADARGRQWHCPAGPHHGDAAAAEVPRTTPQKAHQEVGHHRGVAASSAGTDARVATGTGAAGAAASELSSGSRRPGCSSSVPKGLGARCSQPCGRMESELPRRLSSKSIGASRRRLVTLRDTSVTSAWWSRCCTTE